MQSDGYKTADLQFRPVLVKNSEGGEEHNGEWRLELVHSCDAWVIGDRLNVMQLSLDLIKAQTVWPKWVVTEKDLCLGDWLSLDEAERRHREAS